MSGHVLSWDRPPNAVSGGEHCGALDKQFERNAGGGQAAPAILGTEAVAWMKQTSVPNNDRSHVLEGEKPSMGF